MRGLAPYWIDPRDESNHFPAVELALREPDGLLAVGGDLRPQRLLAAYRQGIFPWYNQGQPILWWSPDPRMVLFLNELRISRRLIRKLRGDPFEIDLDRDFAAVVEACGGPRAGAKGTWITPEMKQAYQRLHELGHAHSVECRQQGRLVGGIYGVAIGGVFFGESMFSHVSDASKAAMVFLVHQLRAWQFGLIDCQVYSRHLATLGARAIGREEFVELLDEYTLRDGRTGNWTPSLSLKDVTLELMKKV